MVPYIFFVVSHQFGGVERLGHDFLQNPFFIVKSEQWRLLRAAIDPPHVFP